jgi:hypothetical protein
MSARTILVHKQMERAFLTFFMEAYDAIPSRSTKELLGPRNGMELILFNCVVAKARCWQKYLFFLTPEGKTNKNAFFVIYACK